MVRGPVQGQSGSPRVTLDRTNGAQRRRSPLFEAGPGGPGTLPALGPHRGGRNHTGDDTAFGRVSGMRGHWGWTTWTDSENPPSAASSDEIVVQENWVHLDHPRTTHNVLAFKLHPGTCLPTTAISPPPPVVIPRPVRRQWTVRGQPRRARWTSPLASPVGACVPLAGC